MPIDQETADALGIKIDSPIATDVNLDLTDPFTQELIKSFEQTAPTAVEIAAEIDAAVKADEADRAIDVDAPLAPVTPLVPPSKPDDDPLAPASDPNEPPDDDLPPAAETPLAPAPPDDDELTRLRGLDAWARGLNPETVAAFDAVESGRAVALPREELEAFYAWKAAGAKPPTAAHTDAYADGGNLDDFADPNFRALQAELQSLKAEIAAGRQDTIAQSAAQQHADMQAHLNARAAIFEPAFIATGAEYGLTPTEVNQALQYAGQSYLIKTVNDELTTFSPTGHVLTEADPTAVARTTLERAIYAIPALRDRAIQAEVAKRIEVERQDIIATNEKKNRAGSLSSAPSAATSMEPVDVRKLTKPQLEAAIAEEIRQTTSA